MFRFILLVVDLYRGLPWWGALGILALLAVGLWGISQFIMFRLQGKVTAAVLAEGTPLSDALVEVHSVEPALSPTEPALIGLDPDDDSYDPELDDLDDPRTTDYFWVDATIAPHDAQAEWDPQAVFVVQRDFEPEEELDFCEEMGLIHTLEVWRNGEFAPHLEGAVAGPQRLRMLFAVPYGLQDAKLAYHFTYFGSLTFPVPVPFGPLAASHA